MLPARPSSPRCRCRAGSSPRVPRLRRARRWTSSAAASSAGPIGEASSRLISPRTAGSNAVRTIPAMSAARARPSTVTPHEPRADSRPGRVCPVSVIASARVRGAAGDAAGSKVMLTRVSTSAAAAGAAATSWSMISSAARGRRGVDRGGDLVGERGSGVGGGVHGDGHPAQRWEVAERSQPGAPVRHPLVGVAGVGQPGGDRDDPQRGGQVAGAPVADQAVPAAVAVLGGQQLGRGEGSGQLERSGVLDARPRRGSWCVRRACRDTSAAAARRAGRAGSRRPGSGRRAGQHRGRTDV